MKNHKSSPHIAVVFSPQHIMNLLQAYYSDLVSGRIICWVIGFPGDDHTYTSTVLNGTISVARQLVPSMEFRYWKLHTQFPMLDLAIRIRKLNLQDLQAQVALLGLYPSFLWASCKMIVNANKIIFLDDGASTLTLTPKQILDGDRLMQPRIWSKEWFINQALSRIAGLPSTQFIPQATLFTCIPSQAVGMDTIFHDYKEFKTHALPLDQTDVGLRGGGSVWLDSSFAELSPEVHERLIASAVQQFDIRIYIPHRRTSQAFTERIAESLNLSVYRPELPIELVIGSLSISGWKFFSPPSSLAFTLPFFASRPADFYIVSVSDWIERQLLKGIQSRSDRVDALIEHTRLIELNCESTRPLIE